MASSPTADRKTFLKTNVVDPAPGLELQPDFQILVVNSRAECAYRIPLSRFREDVVSEIRTAVAAHIGNKEVHPVEALSPGADLTQRILAQLGKWERQLQTHTDLDTKMRGIETRQGTLEASIDGARLTTAVAAQSAAGSSQKALQAVNAQSPKIGVMQRQLELCEAGIKKAQQQLVHAEAKLVEIERERVRRDTRERIAAETVEMVRRQSANDYSRLDDVEKKLARQAKAIEKLILIHKHC